VTGLPEQPTNLRGLRTWAMGRSTTAVLHVVEVCADDDGLDQCAIARGCSDAWVDVLVRLDRAVDLGEADRRVRSDQDRALDALGDEDLTDVERLALQAAVEVYAEALETIAAVPGVRA
jgi:hypothetical protein